MLRNFLKAGIGGAGSQVINFLALPVISRLYTPKDYAVWAVIIATSSILGIIACLRYELAIVIPKDDEEASVIFWLCLLLTGVFALVAVLLILFPDIQKVIIGKETEVSARFVWVVPMLVFLIGFNATLQYWAVRKEAFLLSSLGLMGRACGTVATQIGLALLFSGYGIFLVIGSLVGELIYSLMVITGILYMGKQPRFIREVFHSIPSVAKKHRLFPFYSAPYVIFGTLRSRASVYILDVFVGAKVVGLYAFAQRILNFPVTLISGALRPVLFQKAASEGIMAIEDRLNLILRSLAFLSLPFFIFYLYYPEEIFRIVFGNKWTEGGTIGAYLIWPAYTFLFCNWMDRILDVLRRQRLALVLEIFFASFSLAVLTITLALGYSIKIAIIMQCAILTIYNFTYIYVTYSSANYSFLPLYRLILLMLSIGIIEWTVLKISNLFFNVYLSIGMYMMFNIVLWSVLFRKPLFRFSRFSENA